MKKKNILKEAGVLLIAILMVSSIVVTADTMDDDLEEVTATVDTAYIEYPTEFTLKKTIDVGSSAKGAKCYATNMHNDPNDNLVWFDSSTPGTFNHIADISSTDFLSGGCFVGDTWWVCEYSTAGNSNVWTIDETNGDMLLIGASGVVLNGLAYDPSTETLYGCDSTYLHIINQANGDANPVGPFNTGGLMIGIACDMNGKMYGEDLGTDALYEINTANGAATLIGDLGILLNYAQDIAYDKVNDILYSTGYKGSTNGGGALGTLDLTDGHYTYIGDFPIGDMGCPSEVAGFGIPYIVLPEPGLCCEGSLSWTDVKPETTVTGTFQVCNCGDEGSFLNWQLQSTPSWPGAIWEIEPDSGTGLAEGDCVTITVNVTAPPDKNSEFTGNITMINSDDPSDYCEIDVSLATPRNKAFNTFPLFLRFLEQHPNMFPILRQLMGL